MCRVPAFAAGQEGNNAISTDLVSRRFGSDNALWVESCAVQSHSPAPAQPLILQEHDGEHRVRRFGHNSPFTIKVDEELGHAQDFSVLTEILPPGDIIPFHMHHNAEETLILEEGGATATVGDKRALAGPRSIVLIPRETWVSVTNSGTQSIHLCAVFSRHGFERYIRAASVREGQPVTPLSPDDVARLRARPRYLLGHVERTLPTRCGTPLRCNRPAALIFCSALRPN
jgi:mannose-6-phosphate isomerase-like protein (cupin superfamily)